MASPIAETWIYATMLIENEWGGKGTGFLVLRAISSESEHIFLATNKHVLHELPEKRQNATKIILHFNVRNQDGSISGQTAELPLIFEDGSKRWREHPDKDVDILCFDVTSLFVEYKQKIAHKWVDYSLFADQTKIKEFDITIGEEIVVIGYPLGFKQGTSNFPLLRSGIIATRIGETFEDEYLEPDGTKRKRVIRGFLIDGATIPGSSGSPVVLKPTIGRFVKGDIVMGFSPPLLLGIIAETRYAPIPISERDYILSFAGLGLAFDAETVKETIELFFK